MTKQKIILSIAGSDSSSGAGIQADIKSAAAADVYCATAITAITMQNTLGVSDISILPRAHVEAQIEAVMSDMNVVAIKTGMLPSVEIVECVCDMIAKYEIKNVIVDPVMISTSGHTLVSDEVCQSIISKLLPLATLVTPNIPEAEFISGVKIAEKNDYNGVALKIKERGVKALLLKGGHMDSINLTDSLFDFNNNVSREYTYPKITTKNTHGTGCSLSSYITAFICGGAPLQIAIAKAEELLHEAIERSKNLVWGGGHGPIKHY